MECLSLRPCAGLAPSASSASPSNLFSSCSVHCYTDNYLGKADSDAFALEGRTCAFIFVVRRPWSSFVQQGLFAFFVEEFLLLASARVVQNGHAFVHIRPHLRNQRHTPLVQRLVHWAIVGAGTRLVLDLGGETRLPANDAHLFVRLQLQLYPRVAHRHNLLVLFRCLGPPFLVPNHSHGRLLLQVHALGEVVSHPWRHKRFLREGLLLHQPLAPRANPRGSVDLPEGAAQRVQHHSSLPALASLLRAFHLRFDQPSDMVLDHGLAEGVAGTGLEQGVGDLFVAEQGGLVVVAGACVRLDSLLECAR